MRFVSTEITNWLPSYGYNFHPSEVKDEGLSLCVPVIVNQHKMGAFQSSQSDPFVLSVVRSNHNVLKNQGT